LHKTNLEFIEHGVLVSDYFERRKKRVVITVLRAYVDHVKSDLNLKMPLFYYYVVYLWLGKQKVFNFSD
jgi:hypothetical protein